ncbi:hypothetical protein [Aquimarina sp. I32.4]|uniref:hypothetical protein n=1 Tax=Aquimarina sp. I32.4 TaxID=2053903 RepID=UPI000CDE9C48|nr:hypothetical protein [Aquimarina sp. I32.4]
MISITTGVFTEKNINGSLPSIGLFLGWVLYLKWYSVFNNRKNNSILRVGNLLPELELQDGKKKQYQHI